MKVRDFFRVIVLVVVGILCGCDKKIEEVNITEFERMLAGFPECNIKNVYLAYEDKEPSHSYFKNRNLKPSEIDGEFAYFDVNEIFHGLKVNKIMIPASTFSVYSLFIDENSVTVKMKLKNIFPLGFYTDAKDDDGYKPLLLADPNKANGSILICSEKEGGI